MALSTNRRRGGALAAAGAALSDQQVQRVATQVAQKVLSAGSWSGKTQPRFNQKLGPPNRPKKHSRKQNDTNGAVDSGVSGQHLGIHLPRGLAHSPEITVTARDIMTLSNGTSAGQLFNAYGMSFNTVSANGTSLYGILGGFGMPRLAAFSGLYREFKLISFSFEFVPSVSTSQSGSIAFGFDPDPYAGLPGSYSDPIRHTVSCMSDLQAKCKLVYRPLIDKKVGPKYISNASGTRPVDQISYNTFQVCSANSLPASTTVGAMIITATVNFIGPC